MSSDPNQPQTPGAPEPVLSLSKDLDPETWETSKLNHPTIPLSSPDITQLEIDAVTTVLRTSHLSLGPELPAFEAAFAAYHGVPYAVAVSSGTAGLHLALLTLNIGEGDEVIIPSFTFIAVANAVLHVRATPVFADINPSTLNLYPAAVEKAITPRTRALLVVHTFGIPADMDALQIHRPPPRPGNRRRRLRSHRRPIYERAPSPRHPPTPAATAASETSPSSASIPTSRSPPAKEAPS